MINITPQEKRVLEYVIKGFTNKEIAKEIGLSPHTIKTYVQSLLEKTNLHSRVLLSQ